MGRKRSVHIDSSLPGIIERSGYYAGIGSRKTPTEILALMEETALMLGSRGWTLRSGGAPGADSAFERGCDQGQGKKEIFLPWRRFNGNLSSFINPSEEAEQIAALCHPNWRACKRAARKLHARNCQQICGHHLGEPVDFVLFWAPEQDGIVEGGTATAITLARQLDIPTFNLKDESIQSQWERILPG